MLKKLKEVLAPKKCKAWTRTAGHPYLSCDEPYGHEFGARPTDHYDASAKLRWRMP